MRVLSRLTDLADRLSPPPVVHAHCDLPCGVYDPAQARIEAESVKAIQEKYRGTSTTRVPHAGHPIKEERAELVKHHVDVLWTDYFKPPHFEKYPELHQPCSGTPPRRPSAAKASTDPASGEKMLELIAKIATIFWETKKA